MPSTLNMQCIMNLADNGVKPQVVVELMEESMKEALEPLLQWEGPNANQHLAKHVERAGKLMGSRLMHFRGADSRLFGHVIDDFDDEFDEEEIDDLEDNDDNMQDQLDSELVDRDSISGLPRSLYESTRAQLLAGFVPMQSPVLRSKLEKVCESIIESRREKYHIPIKRSVEAFIAPGNENIYHFEAKLAYNLSKTLVVY